MRRRDEDCLADPYEPGSAVKKQHLLETEGYRERGEATGKPSKGGTALGVATVVAQYPFSSGMLSEALSNARD